MITILIRWSIVMANNCTDGGFAPDQFFEDQFTAFTRGGGTMVFSETTSSRSKWVCGWVCGLPIFNKSYWPRCFLPNRAPNHKKCCSRMGNRYIYVMQSVLLDENLESPLVTRKCEYNNVVVNKILFNRITNHIRKTFLNTTEPFQ